MRRAVAVILLNAALGLWSPSSVKAQQHEHAEHEKQADPQAPASGLAPITDDDRTAAFPEMEGHTVHDTMVNYFVLFDQLEWQTANDGGGLTWDNKGWVGGDVNRLWFRSEGDVTDGALEEAQAHVLYGRAIARWWDLVAGVRQDVRPGPGRTWAAVGIQGLAPYWFEIEATGYVGEGGRTHARFEIEYELLFTNRLILQPLIEVEVYGKSDPERRIGAGLSTADAGLRLRYEARRELAPYIGVTWRRNFGGTADLAGEGDGERRDLRFAFGVRTWF